MPFAFIGSNTMDGVFGGRGAGVCTVQADPATGRLGRVLSVVGGVPDPSWLAPARRWPILYAACHCNEFRGHRGGAVVAFDIDLRTGALAEREHIIIPNPHPTHMSFDASGSWLLVASSAGGALSVIGLRHDGGFAGIAAIDCPDGVPLLPPGAKADPPYFPGTQLPSTRTESTIYPHCIKVDPTGRSTLACDLFQSRIYRYQFDGTNGALRHRQTLTQKAAKSGARLLEFHPKAPVVYSVNEYGVSIGVYRMDGGSLREAQCVSLLSDGAQNVGGSTASGIAVDAEGRFLYASIRGLDELVHLAIDEDGNLEPRSRVSSHGQFPRTITLGPDGRYLYCANTHGDCVATFEVDPTSGRLQNIEVISAAGATHLVFADHE